MDVARAAAPIFLLYFAEMQSEGELFLIGKSLTSLYQCGLLVHACLDRHDYPGRQRFAAIDAADFSGGGVADGLDGKVHEDPSLCGARSQYCAQMELIWEAWVPAN